MRIDARVWPVLGIVGAVVVVLLAGLASAPRAAPVATDRLGPESGTRIADYLARATDSLNGPDEPRYALVSLRAELTPEQAVDLTGDLRVTEVVYRLALPRVATRSVAVGVGAGPASVLGSAEIAADTLRRSGGGTERQQRIDAVSADRIAADCACVLALSVRATPDELRHLAERAEVRAVEALPADAVGGSFALIPLLPENTEIVEPLPDDGPVP